MRRTLIILGVVMLVLGLLWPWLAKLTLHPLFIRTSLRVDFRLTASARPGVRLALH